MSFRTRAGQANLAAAIAAEVVRADTAYLPHAVRNAITGMFHVDGFGALGDNSTDDTAAIQAAINACDAAGGGTVYFPHGVFVTGALTCKSNVKFKGGGGYDHAYTGRGTRLKLKTGTNASMFTVSWASGVTNVEWQDLHLEGNLAGQSATSHGVYFEGWPATTAQHYQQSFLFRCEVKGFRDAGVWIGKGHEAVSVSQCMISNNGGDGVRIETSDCTVEQSHIMANGACGVRLGNSGSLVANNQSIAGNTLHGIAVVSGGADTTLYTQGTFVRDHRIIGNHVDKNGVHGVYVQGVNVLVAENALASNSATTTGTGSNCYVETTLSEGTAVPAGSVVVTDNAFGVMTGLAYSPQYHLAINGTSTVLSASGNLFSTDAGAYTVSAYPSATASRILGDRVAGHFVSASGPTPSIAAGSNNGTSPPNPSGASGATDHRGQLFFGSGSAPAAGQQVTFTFGRPFATAPGVMVIAGNSATAALFAAGVFVSTSTTGFTLNTVSAPAASQANGTYQFFFIAIG